MKLLSNKPFLVSFSGIDGAGKTTQIQRLSSWLNEVGFRVRIVTFWEDVVLFRRLRESISHLLFRGDQGVGSPAAPVQRRDKNVHTWYTSAPRIALCYLDLLAVAFFLAKTRRLNATDVVIFDRFLYDPIANLNLAGPFSRGALRPLLALMPRPDVACLLVADPASARVRKPEYPLEFLYANQASYLALSPIVGMTVIQPGNPDEMECRIRQALVAQMKLNAPSYGAPVSTSK
jgi:hypothetical protein